MRKTKRGEISGGLQYGFLMNGHADNCKIIAVCFQCVLIKYVNTTTIAPGEDASTMASAIRRLAYVTVKSLSWVQTVYRSQPVLMITTVCNIMALTACAILKLGRVAVAGCIISLARDVRSIASLTQEAAIMEGNAMSTAFVNALFHTQGTTATTLLRIFQRQTILLSGFMPV